MKIIHCLIVILAFSSGWMAGYNIGHKNGMAYAVQICHDTIDKHTEMLLRDIQKLKYEKK